RIPLSLRGSAHIHDIGYRRNELEKSPGRPAILPDHRPLRERIVGLRSLIKILNIVDGYPVDRWTRISVGEHKMISISRDQSRGVRKRKSAKRSIGRIAGLSGDGIELRS